MDQADDASLEDLEEVIYLEDMEDIEAEKAVEILEAAPPYPGHPSDYGGTDLNHQPGYHSSPYPTVNVGYTAYPEPGLKAGVNNPNFQAGPNPGMYPPGTSSNQGMHPPGTSSNPGMYPQATGPNPGMYPQASTVTTSVMLPSLRDLPGQTMCPHCNHQVITITDYYTGLMTWMACGCLALVGCWPCCIAPFWMDSCKDVEHRCPNCNNILSFYRRL